MWGNGVMKFKYKQKKSTNMTGNVKNYFRFTYSKVQYLRAIKLKNRSFGV